MVGRREWRDGRVNVASNPKSPPLIHHENSQRIIKRLYKPPHRRFTQAMDKVTLRVGCYSETITSGRASFATLGGCLINVCAARRNVAITCANCNYTYFLESVICRVLLSCISSLRSPLQPPFDLPSTAHRVIQTPQRFHISSVPSSPQGSPAPTSVARRRRQMATPSTLRLTATI